MPTSVKRTTSHKATTVSPTSKAKISTKTQQSTKSHTTSVKKNTTQLSKTKSPSTSTKSKTVQSSTQRHNLLYRLKLVQLLKQSNFQRQLLLKLIAVNL